MKANLNVNPDILIWAIARAGHKYTEFADRNPRVKEWIQQTKRPTVKQLEKFSHKVHLPFGYLFLNKPLKEELPIPFFRTSLRGTSAQEVSLNVFDTIGMLQQRQDWLHSYLKERGSEKLAFVGKYSSRSSIGAIVKSIRETLDLEENWASAFQKIEAAIDHITKKIEDAGIVVAFNSVVENNTSRPITVEECRGFVLVDELAPFMFVNNADAKAAQLFTIVHELAHVWVGKSAGFDFGKLMPANDPTELLCNAVAAEFLVPAKSFKERWERDPQIASVSRHFKVSQIVIARRALDLGKIGKGTFVKFYDQYIGHEQHKRENQSAGGDFYATTKKRLSLTFAAHINYAVKSNQLLYRDAYKLTGLKGDTFERFFSKNF